MLADEAREADEPPGGRLFVTALHKAVEDRGHLARDSLRLERDFASEGESLLGCLVA